VIPRLVVAGSRSGVGKTTVATGLMVALAMRGLRVAGFKVGPDFIDPTYHALATGRAGRNLDPYLSGPTLVPSLFAHGAAGCDLAVVEGAMGLFDGAAGQGELASTAQVSKLLRAPVLLVVDASAAGRSLAALVHGFRTYDPAVRLAGVIVNRVASDAHERMVRGAIEELGIPVVGVLRRSAEAETPARHLGLVPAVERLVEARQSVRALGELVSRTCDLEAVVRLAAAAPRISPPPWEPGGDGPGRDRVRIAVASGPAFTFVYEENLEMLRARGAETAPFDPTADPSLPEGTDAVLVGGGFPEAYAETLSANEAMRRAVAALAATGRPVVAECGGLLYLCERLDGLPMCGVIPARARMTGRLVLGYREARAASDSPLARAGTIVRGHEFHYSVTAPRAGPAPAWEMGGGEEGFVAGSVHASYLHTHWAAFPEIPDRIVAWARRARRAG
jgi:cobyrinic acid a,c-diamide synthase